MLILASASPRRQELLRNARILFKTHPADIPEDHPPDEPAPAYVQRLAHEKALAVFHQLQPAAGTLVLGADTTVVVDGDVLGKPADEQEAARMLRRLSGRQHQVITGVCLVGVGNDVAADGRRDVPLPQASNLSAHPSLRAEWGNPNAPVVAETLSVNRTGLIEDVRSETTTVFFQPVSDEEIEDYVATGEPMDKAGAYAIQGAASRWIPRIEGCYFNVVGLPVPLVCRMLREQGAI